jgi:hypothetical protein
MKQKQVGSPWLLEHFRGALRRRRFWTQLRIEDWWQDRLILPPHRAPSRKFIDAMNNAFEYDANGYSAEAEQLWQAWTQEDPISISARIGNSLSARLRLRTIRVKGQRIRIDDAERRMMAWTMAEGSLYIRLPSVKAAAILAAPGLPIPFVEERHGTLAEERGLPQSAEVARVAAEMELDGLLATLHSERIHPPKSKLSHHARRLLESCASFHQLLFDPVTSIVWGEARGSPPLPSSRLAYLRQELDDFLLELRVIDGCDNLEARWNYSAREHDRNAGIRSGSALALFIAYKLKPAYERIYDCRCTITRKEGEPPGGPFIAFATTFFEQVGFHRRDARGRVQPFPSAETIAISVRTDRYSTISS